MVMIDVLEGRLLGRWRNGRWHLYIYFTCPWFYYWLPRAQVQVVIISRYRKLYCIVFLCVIIITSALLPNNNVALTSITSANKSFSFTWTSGKDLPLHE